jgi:hypothetical protein
MATIKIYGERNSGTNYFEDLVAFTLRKRGPKF